MPRIYLSGLQEDSFNPPGSESLQTSSLKQTLINAEIVGGDMNQGGVIQILVLAMFLFVALTSVCGRSKFVRHVV